MNQIGVRRRPKLIVGQRGGAYSRIIDFARMCQTVAISQG